MLLLYCSFKLRILNVMTDLVLIFATKGVGGSQADVMAVMIGVAKMLLHIPTYSIIHRVFTVIDSFISNILTERVIGNQR